MNSQDLKLGVFIGSTKVDLSRARVAVIDAVLSAGHIPSGMELWAAGHIPTLLAIESQLNLCDLHVILLGARYGSTVKDGLSFTEWEYRRSADQRRPVIAFLLDDVSLNAMLQEQESALNQKLADLRLILQDVAAPLAKIEKTGTDEVRRKAEALRASTDAAREKTEKEINEWRIAKEKLLRFRKVLEARAFCRYFNETHLDRLGTDCVNSINRAINSGSLREGAGWIPSSSERGRRLRSIEQNQFLQRILDRFYEFSTLTKRLENQPYAKQAMARAFWQVMFGRIKRCGYRNLFFESGSTLAFLCEEFEKKIRRSEGDRNAYWKITTNNALVLLELLLDTHLDVSPRPAGAPEDYYGAMFDDVLLKDPEFAPHIPRKLFPAEKNAVSKTIQTLQKDGAPRLYLATASGMDFDHTEEHFRGPHVGSHPNMLFKRAIFKTGEPVVLFLSEGKINKAFRIGECFPVFGPDYSWRRACHETKLAMCVGYSIESGGRHNETLREKRERLREQLRKNLPGFDLDYAAAEFLTSGAFLVANRGFVEVFKKE